MVELFSKYSNIKRVLELKASVVPMYLVRDENTGLYGVQTSLGGFKILPEYPLDENYDLSNMEYATADISREAKIFLIENTAEKKAEYFRKVFSLNMGISTFNSLFETTYCEKAAI